MKRAIILFISLHLFVCNAMVRDIQVGSTWIQYYKFDTFGFYKGGSLHINSFSVRGHHDNESILFVMCGNAELTKYFKDYDYLECEDITSVCAISAEIGSSLEGKDYVIDKPETYVFYLVNCNQTLYSAQLSYTTINPNGEQLPTEQIPFPSLYMVLLGIWALISLSWCFNWLKNRSQRIKLHRIISLLPIAKVAFCASSVYYWRMLSSTGIETDEMKWTDAFFDILFEVAFYSVLLIIASGWGISTNSLGRNIYPIGAVAFGLAIALAASYFLKGYFTFLMMIIYVVIIVTVFRNTNNNLMVLREQIHEPQFSDAIDESGDDQENLVLKYNMFKKFKVIMLGYLIGSMLLLLPIVLFVQFFPWLYQMVFELLQMIMFICVAWTFRLRDVNIYYQLPTENSSDAGTNSSIPSHIVELQTVND